MRQQVYVSKNVLDAAQERISYIFDEFEEIIVSISGGKDSTVLAWLTLQEARRRGRKVGLFFIDEEVVYQSTIDQVTWLMNLYPENTRRLWLQFPFRLTNATSVKEGQLICWEEGKHKIWMRPKVSYSIQHKPWPLETETVRDKNKGFGFYDVIENFQNHREDTAFLVGLRAVESMNRFRAVAKNPGYKDCYWATKCGGPGCASFYPLYDWNFHDIWKFIYDNSIRYSRIYDYQWKKGMSIREIRVSSLIHEKSFRALVELPEFEPKTFDKLSKRISGIEVGHLYGKDPKMLRCQKLPKNYRSWMEYRDFLLDTYPDASKKWIFEKRFAHHLRNNYVARQECRQLILNDYENNLPVDNSPDPREETIKKWRDLL
ncbi:phosphoadenosine phosphosulfate reductase domain-containing protein [Megamonas hypermegale]|uniref:phosphoadenosine phosphosulfate reductase domain-containing protein n=1 Tax=Megamonas hypermegale TaxID=158847 RepID=UPI0026F130CD|nr:phosphoadenosine phosphosulfate reductase family protein [Megamonas hypermegale]